MIELLDLYTANGERTGHTVPRGTPPAPGELYLVVHVWIHDEAGRYLIQQRAHHLQDAPGVWAVTAGHVQAGEDSRAGALRETQEEVGLTLDPAALRLWQQGAFTRRLEHRWLATVTAATCGEPRPGPEVAACRWATKAELRALIPSGGFFEYSYFEDLPE